MGLLSAVFRQTTARPIALQTPPPCPHLQREAVRVRDHSTHPNRYKTVAIPGVSRCISCYEVVDEEPNV